MSRISVCIATYNGERYIGEQLSSILLQLDEEDEIIISDDYSSDNTINVVKSFNDERVKIIYNNGTKGYTANFENALRNSTGEYIFLADQDDVWLPNKVQRSLEILRNKDFLVSNAMVVNAEKKVIESSFFDLIPHYTGFWKNIFKFSYLGCCMCFRRKILQHALPFPRQRKLCTHDNWLFIVASFFYSVEILNEPLILYRRHGNNISTGAEKNYKRNSFIFMLHYRIYLVCNIFYRYLFGKNENFSDNSYLQ